VLPTLLVSRVSSAKGRVVMRTLQSLDQDRKAPTDAFCVERLFPVYLYRHSNLRGIFLGAKCWLETDNRSARLAMSQSGKVLWTNTG
jgi:hypothetical protein